MSLSKKDLEKRIKEGMKEKEPLFHYHRSGNRAWLHIKNDATIGVEWGFGKKATTLAAEIALRDDFENTFSLSLSVPLLFRVHLSYDCRPWKLLTKLVGKHCERNYGFYSCISHTVIHFHTDHMDSGNNTRFSWDKYICHEKLLKGERTVESKVTSSTNINATVDGRDFGYGLQYPLLHIEREVFTASFTRWRPQTWERWNVTTGEAIWRNGKGENGWDCDPVMIGDVSFGTDHKIKNFDDAAECFVEYVRTERVKYG